MYPNRKRSEPLAPLEQGDNGFANRVANHGQVELPEFSEVADSRAK